MVYLTDLSILTPGPQFWSQSIFELVRLTPPSFIPKALADLRLNHHFLVFSAISLGGNILHRYSSSLNHSK